MSHDVEGRRIGWLAARTASLRIPIGGEFLLRRTFGALIAVWGAATIVFVMLFVSGDPAVFLAPETASPAQIAELSHAYGFDQPIPVQYVNFLWNVTTGNFPKSLYTDRPAFEEVLRRVPNTLAVSLSATIIGTLLGLAAGYLAVNGKIPYLRVLPLRVMMVLQSTPSFFLALILILFFSLTLRWLPTGGTGSWLHVVLPIATLSAYVAPSVARLFSASIREVQFEEHIQTARAMGLSERRIRIRHVAINALSSVVALVGLQVGGILGGAVIVENVFAWPGVGELMVRSVNNRDFPVVLAAVMLICLGYVVASLIADIMVILIDPRAQERR